ELVRAAAPERRGAHIGIVDGDPHRLAEGLAARNVVVSPRGDVARVSFHHYSDASDVEALCRAIAEHRAATGRRGSRNELEPSGGSHVYS
ncbi:MAG: hypothetical protein M3548_20925, partial [Actinomycetota bacterium]|nr:hypothetical protein [Actinomycetota bacterium]